MKIRDAGTAGEVDSVTPCSISSAATGPLVEVE